jgi:hypothetical protein
VNGSCVNFNPTTAYTWLIAQTTGGVLGFNANNFNIVTSAANGAGGFANTVYGTFSLSVSGLNLVLNYTPSLPIAITSTASGITSSNAVLDGSECMNGFPGTYYFEYGLTTSYGSYSSTNSVNSGLSVTNPVNLTISNLALATTYDFQLVVVNGAGATYGANQTFTTLSTAPSATTLQASNLTATDAQLNAAVDPNGLATTVSFQYGPTTSYGGSTATTALNSSLTTTQIVAIVVTGAFAPATTNHFRAVAVNADGTNFGLDSVFTNQPAAPSVTGLAASSITATSAQLNASVVPNGLATAVSFNYGPDTGYGQTTASNNLTTGLTTAQNVGIVAGGFAPGTTNHFQAVAANTDGTVLGPDEVFTNQPSNPTVFTTNAANISSVSATLQGIVLPNGSTTMAYFLYGPTVSYGRVSTTNTISTYLTSLSSVSIGISNLQPATTNHFRLVATNSYGTGAGADFTLTNQPAAPLPATLAASSIVATGATLNGTVIPNGLATTAYYQYGPDTNYGNFSATNTLSTLLTSTDSVPEAVTGLQPGTTNHFQLIAANSDGTNYGADLSWINAANAPSVTTLAASSVGATNATLNGTVLPNGATTSVYFEYGLTTSYGSFTGTNSVNTLLTSTTNISLLITNLQPGATYHYQLVAVNSAGTSVGGDMTFANLFSGPVVATLAASSITATSANLNASIDPDGLSAAYYFQYGPTIGYGNYSATNTLSVNLASNQIVTLPISGLVPATTNHFQIVASNSDGVVYGNDITFTNLAAAPFVATLGATNAYGGGTVFLTASILPNGDATTYYFNYGLTTSYGSVSPLGTLTSNLTAPQTVVVSVAGLPAGVPFHYQVVASNAMGSTTGFDQWLEVPVAVLSGPGTVNNQCGTAYTDPGLSVTGAAVQVSAGIYFGTVLKGDGTVVQWGSSYGGELSPPPGTTNVVSLSSGYDFTVAQLANGRAVAWGWDGEGETGVPAGLTNVVAVGAGYDYCIALQSNGTVVGWGTGADGASVPGGLSNVAAISAGWFDALAILTNGTVTGWGRNYYGEDTPPPGLTNVVAISGGGYFSLALESNGTVVAWGNNLYGQTNVPAGLSNVIAISAGYDFCLALQSNGTVVAWGFGAYGQTNVPAGLSNVIAIDAGSENFAFAVQSNGTLVAWGENVGGYLTSLPGGLDNLYNESIGGYVLPANGPGTYTVTNYATNYTGNTASATRTVVVVDTVPPLLTLLGANPFTNLVNTPFIDPGATALDACAGNLTAQIVTNGSINLNATGSYTVTYSVTDPSTNTAMANRTVVVVAPPSATTLAASSITTVGATLNASVNPGDLQTTVYFQYGPTAAYGNVTSSATLTNNLLAGQAVSITISGLTPGTVTHFQVVASNAVGTNYGADVTLANLDAAPVATTLAASEVISNGALLNASVDPNGAATSVYFRFGPSAAYGSFSSTNVLTGDLTMSQAVAIGIVGFPPVSTVHFQVVAFNSVGTNYGGDASFTTLAAVPAVVTLAATDLSTNGATLNGLVNPNGAATTVYMEYGLSTSYGFYTATNSLAGTNGQAVSQSVSNLLLGGVFHCQVVASNAMGTTLGGDSVFTLLSLSPMALTLSPTAVTTNGATLSATINPEGAATAVYFEWGATTNYGETTAMTDVANNGLESAFLSFNGADNYISIPNNNVPVGNSPYTLEAWVNPAAMGVEGIIGWGAYGITDEVNAFRLTGDGFVNYWWANDNTVYNEDLSDQWHHLAAAYDGTNRSLYLDGDLVGQDQPSGHHVPYANNLAIGLTYPAGNEYFNGLMSEVRVWDVGRSQTAIQSTMTTPLQGTENGLVGYWRLNDGGGSVASDGTGRGFNGTLVNNPTWLAGPVGPFNVPVTANLTNLSPGTTYHYQVVASNVNGLTFGGDVAFTTEYALPLAATLSNVVISNNAVILSASINPGGGAYYFFMYGPTTNYGNYFYGPELTGDSLVTVSNVIFAQAGSPLHFQVVVYNNAGEVYGGDQSFAVPGLAPSATTFACTVLSSTSVVFNASVNPNALDTLFYFEYGTSTNYGINTSPIDIGSSNAVLYTNVTVTNLQLGQTYHFQVVASNSFGVNYGGDMNFSTPSLLTLNTGLPQADFGAVAWGDFNNDGKLDIALFGQETNGIPSADVWQNQGNGSFMELFAGLPGLVDGSLALGDMNNQGYLDVLATGYDTNYYLQGNVWTNNGNGTFTALSTGGLQQMAYSSAVWGDFNNDGRLDVVMAGSSFADVFTNNGNGSFTELFAGLPAVSYASLAVGDFDNDGKLDILLSGQDNNGNNHTDVWHNNGDGTFTPLNAGLTPVAYGSVAVGDFDNDGYLDILLTGYDQNYNLRNEVWRNNGNGTFSNINAGLTPVFSGSVAWGDYDNDGYLDILLTGYDSNSTPRSEVWLNMRNGTFSNLNLGLWGLAYGGAAWGDYNNAGRLDILVTGEDFSGMAQTYLFLNGAVATNTPPAAPTGLAAVFSNSGVTLSWNASRDAQTPVGGLSYNLRVGSTPGGIDIVSPEADTSTGFRRLPQRGFIQGLSATLTNLSGAGPFYWSVQAVDTSFAGSPFAPEAVFGALPVVTTLAASNLTVSTATLNGWVNPDGSVTFAWFKYGASTNYGGLTTPTNIGSGGNSVSLAAALTNLVAGGTYHYQLVASNTVGTTAGGDLAFTLLQPPPPSVSSANLLHNGSFTLQFSGGPNRGYALQVSTNLTTWTNLTNLTAGANGVFSYTDTNTANYHTRFYRLETPEGQ